MAVEAIEREMDGAYLRLAETAAAVRSGRLSARQAELVAEAATWNRAAEGDLLAAAADGMVAPATSSVAAAAPAAANPPT